MQRTWNLLTRAYVTTLRHAGACTLVLVWLGLGLCPTVAVAQSPDKANSAISSQAYEIAVIDKSMTGAWKDERAFQAFVRETFGPVRIHRLRFNSQELHDWLDRESQPVPRILCLLDGWTSPEIKRVDLRGSKGGKPLRLTLEVREHQWQAALRRAKEFADHR